MDVGIDQRRHNQSIAMIHRFHGRFAAPLPNRLDGSVCNRYISVGDDLPGIDHYPARPVIQRLR